MERIVITGSTRGIGYALASSFLARGCAVVINGRTEAAVSAARAALAAGHSDAHLFGFAAHMGGYDQVAALWAYSQERLGAVDIWINNAGIGHELEAFWRLPVEEIKRVVDVNILGLAYGCHVAMNGMLSQGRGQIYNMEGFGARSKTRFGLSVYGTSKAAVHRLTESLAEEAQGTPILVGALAPGMVMTDLVLQRYEEDPQGLEKVKPIFNIIGDTAENVAPWLVERMLANRKNGVRLEYLPSYKLALRFLAAPFRKRDLFSDPRGQEA